MAVQLNPNVVTSVSTLDATQSLEDTTRARAHSPDAAVGIAAPVADHVVRVEENAAQVKDEIRADARKDVRNFRGIGAARSPQGAPTIGAERTAPPPTDTARVEAQVAQSEGGQKASQTANAAASARTDAATLETGDTGKAVEASGSQSDASDS